MPPAQIHTLHPGVITPRLPQGVGAKVAPQPNVPTDSSNELPGLAAPDGFAEAAGSGVEEDEVIGVTRDGGVGGQVFPQRLPDAVIKDDLLALAAFFLAQPKAGSNRLRRLFAPRLEGEVPGVRIITCF
jgi:hypothetical protein